MNNTYLNEKIDFDEAIEKELTRYKKICEFVNEHMDDEDDDWDEDESIYW